MLGAEESLQRFVILIGFGGQTAKTASTSTHRHAEVTKTGFTKDRSKNLHYVKGEANCIEGSKSIFQKEDVKAQPEPRIYVIRHNGVGCGGLCSSSSRPRRSLLRTKGRHPGCSQRSISLRSLPLIWWISFTCLQPKRMHVHIQTN